MSPAKKSTAIASTPIGVQDIVARLQRLAKKSYRDGLARYAIPSDKAFGVPVGVLQQEAKRLGKNHDLALALWRTGWYEVRMLAVFLDEPDRVTPEQMDRWCEDFDSWAICDTACFHLFDRTPHMPAKVRQWAKRQEEFVRRAAFALMASAALHDKKLSDKILQSWLPIIERTASDDRNFVKKGISWALRGIGRRGPELFAESMALGERLAASDHPAKRWVGRDVVRDLAKFAGRKAKASSSKSKS